MSETPIIFDGVETLTLRQIDRAAGAPKGTAFRRFKRARARMVEGRDFFRLDAAEHAEFIERLRHSGNVYPSTVHLVLITRDGYRFLTD